MGSQCARDVDLLVKDARNRLFIGTISMFVKREHVLHTHPDMDCKSYEEFYVSPIINCYFPETIWP